MEVQKNKDDGYSIVQTTLADLDTINLLFGQAIALQGKSGYKVWEGIDRMALMRDIEQEFQYKIVRGADTLCVFSIQLSDPYIWGSRDQNNAIYLHRIVVNQAFKGQKQFRKVLDWAMMFGRSRNLKYVRMDTWAENQQLIAYYQSFGFRLIETVKTPNAQELPIQNRNLHVALLEMEIPGSGS